MKKPKLLREVRINIGESNFLGEVWTTISQGSGFLRKFLGWLDKFSLLPRSLDFPEGEVWVIWKRLRGRNIETPVEQSEGFGE